MELLKLRETLGKSWDRKRALAAELKTGQLELQKIDLFQEAVDGLCTCWQDLDPGKDRPHWYCWKGGSLEKVWPRELVHIGRANAKTVGRVLLEFNCLNRLRCPTCDDHGLEVYRLEQTQDGPAGDLWTKTRFILCAACSGLTQISVEHSDQRF